MRMHRNGVYALRSQFVLLVLHQGDEWTDDDREAWCSERGELVYEGLSAAGGHDDHGVATVQQCLDGLPLAFAEIIMAEALAQQGTGFGLVCLPHRLADSHEVFRSANCDMFIG